MRKAGVTARSALPIVVDGGVGFGDAVHSLPRQPEAMGCPLALREKVLHSGHSLQICTGFQRLLYLNLANLSKGKDAKPTTYGKP